MQKEIYMKIMEKKNFLMVILVLLLVFGVFVTGCNSLPNYYNLGDVSEENCALIRVTPVHFTLYFIRDGREIPVNITYNCVAGKGYSFTLIAKIYETMIHTGVNFPTRTEIILNEYDVNEKGTFAAFSSKEVARKAEVHDGFNDGVDMEFKIIR